MVTMLPRAVFADTNCPEGMTQLDCDALYGNWANWIPDEGTDCSGTGTTILTGTDGVSKALNYLVGKGLTPEQAAGIIGNLQIESGLNPSIVQGGGSSATPVPGVGFGIAQWTTAGRQQGLVDLARQEGVDADTLSVQLDYLWQELNTGYKSALADLKKQTDVDGAAVSFMIYYEAPKDHDPNGPNAKARSSAAESALKLYGTSAQSGTGDSVSTDTTTDDNGTCSSAAGGSSFRAASVNILYSTAAGNWQSRLTQTESIITGNDLSVAGLQEVRPDQYTQLQKDLGDTYGMYPSPYGGGAYPGQNTIIWNKGQFTLVEGKAIPGYTVTNGKSAVANVQVKLRDNQTGQEFYLINEHEPVGNSTNDMKWRVNAAKERATYVKNLATSDVPVFLTGDFNSKYSTTGSGNKVLGNNRNNLAYCILTADNLLWDAYDAAKQKTGQCPTTNYTPPEGDHIFMSTNVTATNYNYVNNPGSDHHALFVDVTIPGSSSADFGSGKGSFTDNTSITLPGVQQALARAKEISDNSSALYKKICGSSCYQKCDHLAAGVWGYIGSGYASAATHWAAMKSSGHGHPGDRNPPVGALLFYDTGSPSGHVAVYLGNNKIMSNDVNGNGGAYIVDASTMETGPWHLTYLGWSDPIFHGTKF